MKRILSVLLALVMLLSVSAIAFAEDPSTLSAPPAKEGETVVEFWCIMWETWNQNWLKIKDGVALYWMGRARAVSESEK